MSEALTNAIYAGLADVEEKPRGHLGASEMTFGSDIRSSKYGLSSMEVGEIRTFDAPEDKDKRLIRRAAHNQNERTDRHYATNAKGSTIRITRVR